jgi:hypothetical protein
MMALGRRKRGREIRIVGGSATSYAFGTKRRGIVRVSSNLMKNKNL